MALQSYRDLEVWQKSVELVISAYQLAKQLPDEEKYGLISQIRRAAVSIPANIAEGYGSTYRGEYLRHLSIAKGSLYELETHFVIAVRLNFVDREETKNIWDIAQDVGKMLNRLMQSLS